MEKTRPEWKAPTSAAPGAHIGLYMVLCGERPTLGSMGFDLTGVSSAIIGRGGPLGASALPGGRARIDVPDPTMSGEHVKITPEGDGLTLEDLGSRNGTRLRGVPSAKGVLGHGDWFVVGRSAFVVRKVNSRVDAAPFRAAGSPRLATFLPSLAKTLQTAADLAPSRVPILLLGETGTGKDVLAQEIHTLSGRQGRYIPVNCAALPDNLVESELFGYRKGAFSDAREDRAGLIRSAADGTLLLDEIGDLPLSSQAKLLRVLQDGEVLALGSSTPVRVDLRVLSATQKSLDQMVREGTFRADLLGRLGGFTIALPPLRERIEDLGMLTATFLERHAGADAPRFSFTADACCALLDRRWPLNVRELERVLQAAVELARGDKEIGVEHLGAEPRVTATNELGAQDLEAELRRLLELRSGNVSAVARDMNKARMQIHRWMGQFGLKPDDYRGTPRSADQPDDV